ncbi:type II toxin-antitoxin system death-on-curing family toxin [Micromonospora echinofusca]|uniref:type II toxin-antitoxin system death-on-curing family toxin n=1 Tax=Micromonospora echinofusca TaxID=47858 RepID=UPI0033D93C9A
MPKRTTVGELAKEAGFDLDQALVTLWDAGIENLSGPTDVVPSSRIRLARSSLGLPQIRDLSRVAYWKAELQLDDQSFAQLISNLGINLSSRSRNLPKGAVAKIRNHVSGRGIPQQRVAIAVAAEPLPAAPPLSWTTHGKEKTFSALSSAELLDIHNALAKDFADTEDPITPPGVRDETLLESAAMRPLTAIGDTGKYQSVEMAAAALVHSVVHNHPFHNGNKRSALVAMLVFLERHSITLTCTEDELFRFALKVAQHGLVPKHWDRLSDREVLAIAQWICQCSRYVDRAERPIKWIKLRQILTQYGCELSAPRPGNRIDVYRSITEKGWLSIPVKRRLRVQVAYGGDGREADRDTVKHIRRELRLNEEHGIDSTAFYGGEPAASDFIAKYRKTLKRLAKL